MKGLLAFVAAAFVLTSAVTAQNIPPGAVVILQSNAAKGLCISASQPTPRANIVAVPCGSGLSEFLLPNGSGPNRQVALSGTSLCLTPRGPGNAPLALIPCSNDPIQRWAVPDSTGPIVSQTNSCVLLTQPNPNAPITANTCNTLPNQTWTLIKLG